MCSSTHVRSLARDTVTVARTEVSYVHMTVIKAVKPMRHKYCNEREQLFRLRDELMDTLEENGRGQRPELYRREQSNYFADTSRTRRRDSVRPCAPPRDIYIATVAILRPGSTRVCLRILVCAPAGV